MTRFRRVCKLHPLGRHKGRMVFFYRSCCPTCRPDGWIQVGSAEGKLPSAPARAEIAAVLRAALSAKEEL